MKKILAIALSLIMALGMPALAGAETVAQPEGTYKLGMAIVTSLNLSEAATAERDGNAQIDGTAAAVLVDAQGRLIRVAMDAVQSDIAFSADGAVLSDLATTFPTKHELQEEYAMRPASPIGREWFEQADALCEYILGKTAEEIEGIAVDESGQPTDADLLAGCTMSISDMKAAILAAMESAVDCAAGADDLLGLGIVTDMASSRDATAEADGLCQAYGIYAAAAVNAEGVITACSVNAVQGNLTFDASGAITCDLSAHPADKKTIGEEYGMRKASTIGKEWFEQAEGFEAYAVGKTAAQLEGIALDEAGYPTDADLTASVTMSVAGLTMATVKAVANAR